MKSGYKSYILSQVGWDHEEWLQELHTIPLDGIMKSGYKSYLLSQVIWDHEEWLQELHTIPGYMGL